MESTLGVFAVLLAAAAGAGGFAFGRRVRSRRALGEIPLTADLSVGFAQFDARDRLTAWNQAYAAFCGPAKSVLRRGVRFTTIIRACIDNDWLVQAKGRKREWLAERLHDRSAAAGHREQEMADGRWLRFEDRQTVQGGSIVMIFDITEAKVRETSFRLLFENNPVPMWLSDGNFRFLDVNRAAETAYGYSHAQFLAMTVLDVLSPEERQPLVDDVEHRNLKTYGAERVWTHLRADGAPMQVLPFVEAVLVGGRQAFLSGVVDVTDRVEMERQLREQAEALTTAKQLAEESNRIKAEFLANMSHEIRTPLNGVLAVADVLSRTALDAKQAEMLEVIRNSGESLGGLLSDILDLSRLEAGRLEIASEPFNLAQAVNEVVSLLRLRAEEKALALVAETGPGCDGMVLGDMLRVKQIVTNLLSNAIKFTEAGEIRLTLAKDDAAARYRLAVADTGIGFDAGRKAQIFGRFQQADGSVTRRFGGAGLGLSICRELVELMGGAIDCDSTPGRGATFQVCLPLAAASAPLQAKPASAPEPVYADGAPPLRILVADDHPTNRKAVELMMAAIEAELTLVDNGQAAVEAYVRGRYDVVLMDVQMPVLDGLSATRLIRQHEAREGLAATPILVLTANAQAEHVAKSYAAGADGHLVKPFSVADVMGAVYAAVEKSLAGGGAGAALDDDFRSSVASAGSPRR